jgi:hypothetical protein
MDSTYNDQELVKDTCIVHVKEGANIAIVTVNKNRIVKEFLDDISSEVHLNVSNKIVTQNIDVYFDKNKPGRGSIGVENKGLIYKIDESFESFLNRLHGHMNVQLQGRKHEYDKSVQLLKVHGISLKVSNHVNERLYERCISIHQMKEAVTVHFGDIDMTKTEPQLIRHGNLHVVVAPKICRRDGTLKLVLVTAIRKSSIQSLSAVATAAADIQNSIPKEDKHDIKANLLSVQKEFEDEEW